MNIEKYQKRKEELKLTYDEIAARSNISKRTIAGFFSGEAKYANPSIATLTAIENALGLSKPLEWTDEEKALGVTDSVRLDLNVREYEWHELGNEVYAKKGEDYYNVIRDMIKAAIKQK